MVSWGTGFWSDPCGTRVCGQDWNRRERTCYGFCAQMCCGFAGYQQNVNVALLVQPLGLRGGYHASARVLSSLLSSFSYVSSAASYHRDGSRGEPLCRGLPCCSTPKCLCTGWREHIGPHTSLCWCRGGQLRVGGPKCQDMTLSANPYSSFLIGS